MIGGLLIALVAAQAPSRPLGSTPITYNRLQEVAREAENLCPRASNEVGGQEGANWLAAEADRRGYTLTEKSLLLNLCLFYSLGKSDEIRRSLPAE